MSGGTTYNNFDTSATMYSYKSDTVGNVKTNITIYAGRIEGGDFTWKFTAEDDVKSDVNIALMASIENYKTTLVSLTIQ
ncbi:hypothetical protein [Clostridium cellulovorans]|uniref:hypothetical protein n=1 Tax=Clostridium cellulovorans TaxID=1493 RepID=UPI0001A97443|nr:hypothetical protein [Clostridium cellulovorans]